MGFYEPYINQETLYILLIPSWTVGSEFCFTSQNKQTKKKPTPTIMLQTYLCLYIRNISHHLCHLIDKKWQLICFQMKFCSCWHVDLPHPLFSSGHSLTASCMSGTVIDLGELKLIDWNLWNWNLWNWNLSSIFFNIHWEVCISCSQNGFFWKGHYLIMFLGWVVEETLRREAEVLGFSLSSVNNIVLWEL